MNSLAPDSTEVLAGIVGMWDAYMGAQWQPGDIYSLDLVRQLRASGRQASRSTVGKWLRDMAERGELIEVRNVIHPVHKRRCTVYRKPARTPAVSQPSAPSLSEVPADNDDAGKRRPTGKGVLRVSPKSRK